MDIKQLYKIYQEHPVITTDSRDCPEGSIFVALKGETFNGNTFAVSALQKGCSTAIIDEPTVTMPSGEAISFDDNGTATISLDDGRKGTLILVSDALQTFKDLAREHRRQFNIPVIGVTGTNGKTTTKELIAAVLSQKFNVLYTQGNFNNDVGVPKTLFRLTKDHEIAVIEMGASHPGDIKTLAETAEPTCGLITNVGRAHLQGFGSFEGVVKTKCELYDFLRTRQDSLVIINADNEILMDQISDDDSFWVTSYSTNKEYQTACITGEIIACDPFLKFRWREPLMVLEEEGRSLKWHKIQTHLIGSYNIDNMLAAIAVGINFGVDRKKICDALENYVPSNNRSQMTVTEHNHLVVDAYNANPTSMKAAIDNFKLMEVSPKMTIIGKMGELGDVAQEEHQRVVDMLAEAHFDKVWLVGDEFADTDRSMLDARLFHDVEEVKAAIKEQQPCGYYILIKGSNSNRLFELPELL